MVASSVSQTVGRRYVLHEPLGAGGMGAVYRAQDRLTGRVVALKRVTMPADQLTFASRSDYTNLSLALAQEFKMLASLRHPYIISVLDYGFDESRQPFFTMSLLDDAQTIVEAGQGRDLETKVNLLIQVLRALVYLHRRGVLHRDLKPGNVLVVDDQVKVLDFGLSVMATPAMEYDSQATAGTFAYMAPELLGGAPVTRASDLYAVGVMAYELLAGQFPYNDVSLAALLSDILTKPVDVKSIGISDELAAVLERLLVKTREARYEDAREVIRDLCNAVAQPLPQETVEIRESFLQAARFVDRDAEFGQLSSVLRQAKSGQGSAWLIGGESGVGKSRLVDELRTLALVEGTLVLQGQAIREGGSTYQLWRPVFRRLSSRTELGDLEAGVLKGLVPDIDALLGRDVPDAPPLDPQGAQRRLFGVVADMFHRQSQPVLVILEDLQWARSESLAMIGYLAQTVADLTLMLLGNYRDDERPGLTAELPGMHAFRLERLTGGDIAKLSASMLGEAGRQRRVVDLLQRETEGNPFFVVEVVRALAEEAGRLDRISDEMLPERVLAGGVQEVIQRRLSRVPAEAQPLLQLAAVAGRELDVSVLRAMDPDVDLDRWLTTCANAAVLDVQGELWRFAHDKLREAILDGLSGDVHPGLHRQVAEAIETVYPDAPEQAAALAYHWAVVGDDAKELHYTALAGQQAYQNSANIEAIDYLNRALELFRTLPDTVERAQQELPLQTMLGAALLASVGYTRADVGTAFDRARELCQRVGETPLLFPTLRGLYMFYLGRGDIQASQELGEQLLALAQDAQDSSLPLEAHHVLGISRFHAGNFVSAQEHFEQALSIYDLRQHRSHIHLYGYDPAVSCMVYASWALCYSGYPDRALEKIRASIPLAEELNHPLTLAYAQFGHAMTHQHRGEGAETQALAEAILEISEEHMFPHWLAWGNVLRGWALAAQGQTDEGIAQIRRGLDIHHSFGQRISLPTELGLLAEACLLGERAEEGLAAVKEAFGEVNSRGEAWWSAELHRLKGELLIVLSDENRDEAEACFRQAIAVAQQQANKYFELAATTSLARLLQNQGRGAEARKMLVEICNWFVEGFDTAGLESARALLEELL